MYAADENVDDHDPHISLLHINYSKTRGKRLLHAWEPQSECCQSMSNRRYGCIVHVSTAQLHVVFALKGW